VPANRSRTERWRECLDQIHERGGALEIALAGPAGTGAGLPNPGSSLIWRVRILGISEEEILVEAPCALGQSVRLNENVPLLAIMSIGQNRWMFHTRTMGYARASAPGSREPAGLRLRMPDAVERCQRRNFYRISTAELSLPRVECWPLLDPSSVVAAEVANRAQIASLQDADGIGAVPATDAAILPEVGPSFKAKLVNIGGGGAGLVIDHADASAVDRPRLFWLRVDLTPQIPAPLGLTARLVHTHVDSGQNLYAGLAFEFGFNPSHRDFIVEQICRYAAAAQRLPASAV
jgi:hypothetical protein